MQNLIQSALHFLAYCSRIKAVDKNAKPVLSLCIGAFSSRTCSKALVRYLSYQLQQLRIAVIGV